MAIGSPEQGKLRSPPGCNSRVLLRQPVGATCSAMTEAHEVAHSRSGEVGGGKGSAVLSLEAFGVPYAGGMEASDVRSLVGDHSARPRSLSGGAREQKTLAARAAVSLQADNIAVRGNNSARGCGRRARGGVAEFDVCSRGRHVGRKAVEHADSLPGSMRSDALVARPRTAPAPMIRVRREIVLPVILLYNRKQWEIALS